MSWKVSAADSLIRTFYFRDPVGNTGCINRSQTSPPSLMRASPSWKCSQLSFVLSFISSFFHSFSFWSFSDYYVRFFSYFWFVFMMRASPSWSCSQLPFVLLTFIRSHFNLSLIILFVFNLSPIILFVFSVSSHSFSWWEHHPCEAEKCLLNRHRLLYITVTSQLLHS